MTSQRGSFAVIVELDRRSVEQINHRLLQLPQQNASRAMRRGFGKWSRSARRIVEANAPFGRATPTERIRGSARPNVHLKFNAATRIKGYRKGLVVWAAVGIKEIPGSYLTPHWYLGWVERGHAIRRKSTDPERALMASRGYTPKEAKMFTVARVPPNPFMRRSAGQSLGLVLPMLQTEIDKEIRKVNGG